MLQSWSFIFFISLGKRENYTSYVPTVKLRYNKGRTTIKEVKTR